MHVSAEKDLYPKGVCGTYRNFPTSAKNVIGQHWMPALTSCATSLPTETSWSWENSDSSDFTEMFARDRRRERNDVEIRPIQTYTAHQQHVPQQHQEENDVGTCTLHYQEIEKSSRDHRRNKKSRTGTVPQAECMYQQERIHPAKRTNQTCRHRRTEQLHPARFLRRRGMGRSTVYVRQEKDTANEI